VLRVRVLRVVQVLLLELEDGDAFLAVRLGFGGALGVDAAFGKVVGAAAGDDQGAPAVALGVLGQTAVGGLAEVTYYTDLT
jgi:hypothetical protein